MSSSGKSRLRHIKWRRRGGLRKPVERLWFTSRNMFWVGVSFVILGGMLAVMGTLAYYGGVPERIDQWLDGSTYCKAVAPGSLGARWMALFGAGVIAVGLVIMVVSKVAGFVARRMARDNGLDSGGDGM